VLKYLKTKIVDTEIYDRLVIIMQQKIESYNDFMYNEQNRALASAEDLKIVDGFVVSNKILMHMYDEHNNYVSYLTSGGLT
jgi:hypothetical protein